MKRDELIGIDKSDPRQVLTFQEETAKLCESALLALKPVIQIVKLVPNTFQKPGGFPNPNGNVVGNDGVG